MSIDTISWPLDESVIDNIVDFSYCDSGFNSSIPPTVILDNSNHRRDQAEVDASELDMDICYPNDAVLHTVVGVMPFHTEREISGLTNDTGIVSLHDNASDDSVDITGENEHERCLGFAHDEAFVPHDVALTDERNNNLEYVHGSNHVQDRLLNEAADMAIVSDDNEDDTADGIFEPDETNIVVGPDVENSFEFEHNEAFAPPDVAPTDDPNNDLQHENDRLVPHQNNEMYDAGSNEAVDMAFANNSIGADFVFVPDATNVVRVGPMQTRCLSKFDVLLGKGGHCTHFVGNQIFLQKRDELRPRYRDRTNNNATKHLIQEELLQFVSSRNGQFLQKDTTEDNVAYWNVVTDRTRLHRKAAQALREERK